MDSILLGLGVAIFAILVLYWLAKGVMNDAQRRKDMEEEARLGIHRKNVKADNADSDSELSRRVSDRFD